MGKKSKLKQIRRIARMLPEVLTSKVEVKIVTGSELLAKGVTTVQDIPVSTKLDYKQKTKVAVPLNHNRKMKQIYNKYGAIGVNTYINQVQQFNEEANKKTA